MMIQSLGSNNIFNNCKNEARDKLGLDNTESNLKFDKLKRKTFNAIYTGSDYSTKNSSKNGLDYTFLSHRSQISTDKLKNTSRDYIYDLTNTWLLNLELINNLAKAFTLKSPDFASVLGQIGKLNELFQRKSEIRNKLVTKRGKILIDKQITEEYRRKIEENSELYREQTKETEENVDNKEEYIKIFEKKLKEVEIYVQKHTKNTVNSKFEVYKNFKMNDFINENTELLRKKEQYGVQAKQLLQQLQEIKQENCRFSEPQAGKMNYSNVNNYNSKKYVNVSLNNINNNNNNFEVSFNNTNVFCGYNTNKNEDNERKKSLNASAVNFINTDNNNNKRNSTKAKYENSRIGEIMKQYFNQIKMIESKNRLMKANLSNFKSKCFNNNILKKHIEKLKREQRLKEKAEQTYELANQPSLILPNENNNLTYIEKSNINMDLTRKLNTFMDFSVFLNKRDETNYNDLLANKTTDIFGNQEKQIWDVSCIEKN